MSQMLTAALSEATETVIPEWLKSRKLAALVICLIWCYLVILTVLVFWAFTGHNPLEILGIGVGGGVSTTAMHLREQGQSDRSPNYGGQYGYLTQGALPPSAPLRAPTAQNPQPSTSRPHMP